MKIAYICQTYPPMVNGQSIMLKQLAEGMANRGHDVLVCCASNTGQPHTIHKKPLQISTLRSFPNPLRTGQRFMIWPEKSLESNLAAFNPDIIHLHDPLVSGYIGMRCANSMQIPVVLTLHQLPWYISEHIPFPSIKERVEDLLWDYGKFLLSKSDALIAPTSLIADIIEENTGFPVHVISNGVNLKKFSPIPRKYIPEELCEKYGLHPDRPVILHVGQIIPEKQVDIVVKACLSVMDKTNAQLLVAGNGISYPAIKNLCQESRHAARCHLPGYVDSNGDLAALYQIASVFVMASEIETQGIVALEAAASGLPIVAVNATCIPDIVRHGRNGFLVPPKNIVSMADAIQKILGDQDLAQRMGHQGVLITQTHDLELTLSAHEDIYQQHTLPLEKSIPLREIISDMELVYK